MSSNKRIFPEKGLITIEDTDESIKLSLMYDCDDLLCPELFHTVEVHTYAEAAAIMQGYANRFLDKALIEGSV